ncbi:T-cell leukemia translocation-altered gene protein isoform X1 [Tupaia chinensis]|uniref:T-cell leukemia translocation-altered gene protein isoform X1 n=1 Tax=Tupaia chinensis TaxID=246437 RepID=UPI000FFC5B77|nr:T-cell leukemia translocation-altered gene protein isoform X1 [Tupaia chinensis]
MAEPWSAQSLQALPATVLGALGALGSEFLREWEAQDMRVTLFKNPHQTAAVAPHPTWADACSDLPTPTCCSSGCVPACRSGRPERIHPRWLHKSFVGNSSKRTSQNSQRIREGIRQLSGAPLGLLAPALVSAASQTPGTTEGALELGTGSTQCM